MLTLKTLFTKDHFSPKQYFFPYFFNLEEFNNAIKPFNIETQSVFYKKETMKGIVKYLKIISKETELRIDYWDRLMIDHDNNLIIWNTPDGLLNIKIYSLYDLSKCLQEIEVNISQLKTGKNTLKQTCRLYNFVTFVKKENLKYNLDYYDNHAIAIINTGTIELIPFNWFNEKGGDYGYVWPAIAQIDMFAKKIKGSGMRMANFEVDLYSHSELLVS